MDHRWSALALAWLVATAACAAEPPRLLDVQKREVDFRTLDHHLELATAARQAAAAGPAAEAVATMDLLPMAASPRTVSRMTGELAEIREWLRQRSEDLYAEAMAARVANDFKVAVKRWLLAVKCDPSVMIRDDRGLKDLALGALRKAAAQPAPKPEIVFQLGRYSWLFGDLAAAAAAFEQHGALETDAYKRWRGQLWRDRMRTELGTAAGDARRGGAVSISR